MDKNNKLKLEAVLTEYKILREEIQRRSTNQMLCVTISIVAIGALLSFIFENPEFLNDRLYIFLIISWILSIFGILWLDHHKRIFEIGEYIREKIEKEKQKEIFGSSKKKWIEWETYLAKRHKYPWIAHIIPILYFIGPAILFYVIYILQCISIQKFEIINYVLVISFFPVSGLIIKYIFSIKNR